MKIKLLVTGGAGFIGSNFIRQLLLDKCSGCTLIINYDSLSYSGNIENLSDVVPDSRYVFVNGDICDAEKIRRVITEHQIDAIINFAAESHVDRSIDSPEQFVETNVVGTLRLLNAAKAYWSKLNENKKKSFRFVHVSTDEVYGTLAPNDDPWHEGCPYAPNSPYAASKAASDHLVRSFHNTYQLPTITTNCSNNYGPFQFPEKLIPLIILNALEGRPLPIYGDGQQIRDWLYVSDHTRALWKCLAHGRVGDVYNIGGLNEKTNLEIVHRICSLLDAMSPRPDGKPYCNQITHVADRPGHDRRYAIDSGKIQRELGWFPMEDFNSGLEKTVNWYINNKNWSAKITEKQYARERLGVNNFIA